VSGGNIYLQKPSGKTCSDAIECVSDHCVDGVCCDSVCGGTCQACNLAGNIGICTTRSADDNTECGTCQKCDGSNTSCQNVTSGQEGKNCTAVCTECNGSGSCANVANHSEDNAGTYKCETACTECNGSGSCTNFADNTGDSQGLHLCDANSGDCYRCLSGSCTYQTAAQDLFSECTTASPGQADSCKSPTCSGTGYACGYLAAGEQSQATCKRCSGSSYDPANVTDNTQDAEGSNLCNQICKKCSSGSCGNQSSAEDLFYQCELISCGVILNAASGLSCTTVCAGYSGNSGLCNGAGACASSGACGCLSIGNDTGGTNGHIYMYGGMCTDWSGYTCATGIADQGYPDTCQGIHTWWTYCNCGF